MSLKSDEFPSSHAFEAISASLKKDEQGRKDAISQGKGIFAIKLKNTAGKEQAWYIDLKETGTVGLGEAPAGKKADVTLSLSDENFDKLVTKRTGAQNLYMSGNLKIKGNIMKATKVGSILEKAGGQSKL